MDPTALNPVTILLPTSGSGYGPGSVTVDPIGIVNSDGTPPSVQLDNLNDYINSSSVTPSVNTPGDFAWTGTANSVGVTNVTFLADGVPNYTMEVTVANSQDETLQINQTAVTVNPPAPPAGQAGTMQAVPAASIQTKPPANQVATPVAGTLEGNAALAAGQSVAAGREHPALAAKEAVPSGEVTKATGSAAVHPDATKSPPPVLAMDPKKPS